MDIILIQIQQKQIRIQQIIIQDIKKIAIKEYVYKIVATIQLRLQNYVVEVATTFD